MTFKVLLILSNLFGHISIFDIIFIVFITTDIFDIIVRSKSIPQDLDKDLIQSIQDYSHKIDFSTLKKKLPN